MSRRRDVDLLRSRMDALVSYGHASVETDLQAAVSQLRAAIRRAGADDSPDTFYMEDAAPGSSDGVLRIVQRFPELSRCHSTRTEDRGLGFERIHSLTNLETDWTSRPPREVDAAAQSVQAIAPITQAGCSSPGLRFFNLWFRQCASVLVQDGDLPRFHEGMTTHVEARLPTLAPTVPGVYLGAERIPEGWRVLRALVVGVALAPDEVIELPEVARALLDVTQSPVVRSIRPLLREHGRQRRAALAQVEANLEAEVQQAVDRLDASCEVRRRLPAAAKPRSLRRPLKDLLEPLGYHLDPSQSGRTTWTFTQLSPQRNRVDLVFDVGRSAGAIPIVWIRFRSLFGTACLKIPLRVQLQQTDGEHAPTLTPPDLWSRLAVLCADVCSSVLPQLDQSVGMAPLWVDEVWS